MTNSYVILKSEKEIIRVPIDRLMYIKVDGGLMTYNMEGNVTFSCIGTLKKIEQSLSNSFIRINRSYLVNINKVVSLNKVKKQIVMIDGSRHKVSERRLVYFKRLFINLSVSANDYPSLKTFLTNDKRQQSTDSAIV